MLPKTLKYGSKVESAPARSYRSNIAPQNGSGPYNLGDTVIINIPTRQNLVMSSADSYLKFQIQQITCSANGSGFRWDSCGAHGLIQRIRIFHGSNLLEDIDNYGLLTKMLFDIQQPTDSAYGKLNLLAGTRSDLVVSLPTHTACNSVDNVAANINTAVNGCFSTLDSAKCSASQVNSGDALRVSGGNASVIANNGVTGVQTYCLNLTSLVGSLCSQNYIPLFAMTSSPLRVEIQLVDNLVKAMACLQGYTLASGIITNVEYIANMIELGDSAMSMVSSSLQGQPLQFVLPSFRNYQYTASLANNTSTGIAFPIPAKFSSLKSIYTTVRDNSTGASTYFPFSSVTMGITDYTFRVGSQLMPPRAPNDLTSMFAELMKSIDSLGNINHQPSIEKYSYTLATSSPNTTASETNQASAISSGSFYVGLDLENYSSAPKDSIFAGYNSNTDDIFWLPNFTQSTGAAVQTRFDAFANFDALLVFDNNTAYVKF